MEFFRRANLRPARLGVFPGAFNPITLAHLALAEGALTFVDEIVFVLPRVFPHKHYSGATFDHRLELIESALPAGRQFSIAASDRGLFIEIARECREHYGPDTRISFLCGRDAAERIAGWDYGRPGAWQEMLREFDLLVAARGGAYRPSPAELGSFRQIAIDAALDAISSSEVRRRIAQDEAWQHLVPEAIHARVREIYRVV